MDIKSQICFPHDKAGVFMERVVLDEIHTQHENDPYMLQGIAETRHYV